MNFNKQISKLLSKFLLIPISVSCLNCHVYSMELNERVKAKQLASELLDTFKHMIMCMLEDKINEFKKKILKEKIYTNKKQIYDELISKQLETLQSLLSEYKYTIYPETTIRELESWINNPMNSEITANYYENISTIIKLPDYWAWGIERIFKNPDTNLHSKYQDIYSLINDTISMFDEKKFL